MAEGIRPVRTIGLVGCGRMGSQIVSHLLRAGWHVTVTDVDSSAVDALVALGARGAQTSKDVLAESDVTLVVVVDDEQVRQALGGGDAVFEGVKDGSIVAICSSVKPQTCRDLASEGTRLGVDVLDVGLVGGELGAENGALLLLVGGDAKSLDLCRPAFSSFARDIHHVGAVGAGQVAKTVNNVLLWACLRADMEALRLGKALGIDPANLRAAVALGSGANRPLEEWGQHRLRWPTKDLEMALALAEETGVDMPLVRALEPLMRATEVQELHDLL